jgi:hypothetical protein
VEKEYYQRYRICEEHLKLSSLLKDGVQQRFCQQCGRFHLLADFDGDKRRAPSSSRNPCILPSESKGALEQCLRCILWSCLLQASHETGSCKPDPSTALRNDGCC